MGDFDYAQTGAAGRVQRPAEPVELYLEWIEGSWELWRPRGSKGKRAKVQRWTRKEEAVAGAVATAREMAGRKGTAGVNLTVYDYDRRGRRFKAGFHVFTSPSAGPGREQRSDNPKRP